MRWSLARPERVADARWAPVDGFRIAYLAGGALRIVNGDGTADHRYAAARSGVAPAWRPDGTHVLAYVDARDRVTVVAVDTRRCCGAARPSRGPVALTWSPDGRRLLAAARGRIVLFGDAGRRLASRAMPAGAVVLDAEWSPARRARSRSRGARRPRGRSEVLLLDGARRLRGRTLFTGPGRFGDVAWSPAGDRLLIGWPEADQWLFLRPRGGGRLAAVGNIARQFMPGASRPPFPRSVRWCCGAPRDTP